MVELKRRDRSLAIVGAYVLAAGIAFLLLFGVATNRSLTDRRAQLWIELSSAEGLKKGDAVLFRGVQVGEVKRIDFAADDGVLVRAIVTRPVPVTSTAQARLVAADMFGRQSVVIAPASGGRALQPGDTLRGVAPVSLTARVEGMASNVERIIGDTTVTAVHALLGEVTAAARALTDALQSTSAGFAAQQQPVQQMLLESAAVAANLRAATDTSAMLALRAAMHGVLRRTDMMMARLDSTSLAASHVLQRVDTGSGNLGLLANDAELYQRAVGTLASLEALLQDVRRNPKRYINVSVF